MSSPDAKAAAYRRSLGSRLAEVVRRFKTKQDAAEAAGVSVEQLNKWIAGVVKVPAEALQALSGPSSVDFAWLATGEGTMLASSQSQSSRILIGLSEQDQAMFERPVSLAEVVTVPRYEVRASAGSGTLVEASDTSEYFAVGRDWLRRNLPGWAPLNSSVGVLDGSGDSMEPTIRDGDTLVIVRDVEWRIVERGGIFVFSLDDRLLLKRLQVLENGDLRVISDNKAYEPFTVVARDIPHRIIIHGQVFFAGGKPRTF